MGCAAATTLNPGIATLHRCHQKVAFLTILLHNQGSLRIDALDAVNQGWEIIELTDEEQVSH